METLQALSLFMRLRASLKKHGCTKAKYKVN